MNNKESVIEITNEDFFYMIEDQVRNWMKRFESKTCLPKAKTILEKSNISLNELKDYPIEGYYHETENLKLYFKILRNLQHNESLWNKFVSCEELTFIQSKCDNDIFGIEDLLRRNVNAPVKRRYDILTLTMEDILIFTDHNEVSRPWTIKRIMDGLSTKYGNRPNLVELAYLTGKPECLCCGAESNSLNRMFACITGSYSLRASFNITTYIWKVDPEVENLGKKLVDEYNKLFEYNCIFAPTLENHSNYSKRPKLPRVALLGYITKTGEYYHWILDEAYRLTDKYTKEIITTETYIKKIHPYLNVGNIFNAVPL